MALAAPPIPYGPALQGELVSIYVGSEAQPFVIHKEVLCNKVDYFRKIFTGGLKKTREGKAREGKARFPKSNHKAFALFFQWVYASTLPALPDSAEPEEALQYANALIDLHIIAEEMVIRELASKVMDQVQDFFEQNKLFVSPEQLRNVFENTGAGSRLRIFCVELLVFELTTTNIRRKIKLDSGDEVMRWDPKLRTLDDSTWISLWELKKDYFDFDKAFTTASLAVAAQRKDPRESRYVASPCYFHWHEEQEGEACKAGGGAKY